MEDLVYQTLAATHTGKTAGEIAAALGEPVEAVRATLADLARARRAVPVGVGEYLADTGWERIVATTRRVLGKHHRKFPLQKGLPAADLALGLQKAATTHNFDALVRRLALEKIVVREGDTVRLPDFAVTLPPTWQAAADDMVAVWKAAGLDPPDPANFAAHYPKDVVIVAIVQILVDDRTLIALPNGHYLHAETVASARQTLRDLAARDGSIHPGTARDALNSSRSRVLPLLDYFHETGFLRRVGDLSFLGE